MPALRRFLLVPLLTLLAVAAVLLIAVAILLRFFAEDLIEGPGLRYGLNWLESQGWTAQIQTPAVDFEWTSFPSATLSFQADRICLSPAAPKAAPGTEHCASRPRAVVSFTLGWPELFTLRAIGPVSAEEVWLRTATGPSPDTEAAETEAPWEGVRTALEILSTVSSLPFTTVEIPKVHLEPDRGSGSIRCRGSLALEDENTYECKAAVSVTLPSSEHLSGNLLLARRAGGRMRLEVDAKGYDSDARVDIAGGLRESSNGSSIEAVLSAEGRPGRKIRRALGPLTNERLRLKGCRIVIPVGGSRPLTWNSCLLEISARIPVLDRIERFALKLDGELDNDPLVARFGARLSQSPRSHGDDLFKASGYAEARLVPHPTPAAGATGTEWSLVVGEKTYVELKVPSFQSLSRVLETTSFAPPAPLVSLEGPLILRANALDSESGLKLPFEVSADLKSADQRLRIAGDGVLDTADPGGPRLNAELRFLDGLLVLPDHRVLQNVASSVPDSRIGGGGSETHSRFALREEPEADEDKAGLRWELRAVTQGDATVGFATDLAKKPIRTQFRLVIGSARPLGGKIQLRPTQLKLFGQEALLRKFEMTLLPDQPASVAEIRGLVVLDRPGYEIRARLLGTVKEPKVVLESTPPLTEEEIIAFVLYGRPPNQLGYSERSSVAGFTTLLLERAIALGTLSLLASSPVEGLRWDESSRSLVATLRLADETSLEVGTRGEAQPLDSLGVRRRLGENFAISTEIELNSTLTEPRGVSTFLEWFWRY